MTRRHRAFTLVEMLVTVGLVILLATLVVVSTRGVRALANRSDSLGSLRSMGLAYSAYSSDNRQQLMPGYADAPMLRTLGINPKLSTDQPLDPNLDPRGTGTPTDPNDASSYVWRLAEYLNDGWRTMFVDYRNQQLLGRLQKEVDAQQYGPGSSAELGVSRIPSFGMNSVFVGGDNVHGGDLADRNPWMPDAGVTVLAATRFSEVKNPAQLIVFAPSSYADDSAIPMPFGDIDYGSAELRPFTDLDDIAGEWQNQQWHIESGAIIADGDFSDGGGYVHARWGTSLPAARLDGSVSILELDQYHYDMKLWSPFVTGDYRVPGY